MKTLCLALALFAPIPASAKDISLKLDDGQQQAILNLQQLEDQCVAGVLMRGDATVCRNISAFLGGLGAAVRQSAADQAAKDAAEADMATKTAAAARAKATADQAAAEKAARDATKAPPAAD